MLRLLIVLLLAVPFVDLLLLVEITRIYGFFSTLGAVILTGLIGAALVRREGRDVLMKLQSSITAKEVSRNVIEGVLLTGGAIGLLIPGLISDFLGLLMVIRPIRERVTVKIAEKLESSASMSFEVQTF